MTKEAIDLARHDERLKTLETASLAAGIDRKAILEDVADIRIKLVKYKNSNYLWGLTLAAIQGIITTLAMLASGQSPAAIISYIQHIRLPF